MSDTVHHWEAELPATVGEEFVATDEDGNEVPVRVVAVGTGWFEAVEL